MDNLTSSIIVHVEVWVPGNSKRHFSFRCNYWMDNFDVTMNRPSERSKISKSILNLMTNRFTQMPTCSCRKDTEVFVASNSKRQDSGEYISRKSWKQNGIAVFVHKFVSKDYNWTNRNYELKSLIRSCRRNFGWGRVIFTKNKKVSSEL
jgi:hypothetical protein